VKEDYFDEEGILNSELLRKLSDPPCSTTYSLRQSNNALFLSIKVNGDIRDINVLDHYLKFEKEEFVDTIILVSYSRGDDLANFYDIKGHVFQNGKPLKNCIVSLNYSFNSITDENGNYFFKKILKMSECTLSFKIGNTRYNSSVFSLQENKIINFNNGNITIGINEPEEIPSNYSLSQNYPNPFNPTTNIQFTIPKNEYVKLVVYDITGRIVKELVSGYKIAGTYNIEFNASGYASGTYYYKLESGEYKNIQKIMLVK
jgi:hypothetical protein